MAAFAIFYLKVRIAVSSPSACGTWTTSTYAAPILNAGLKSPWYGVIALTKSASVLIVDRDKATIHPRPRYAPPWLNFFKPS